MNKYQEYQEALDNLIVIERANSFKKIGTFYHTNCDLLQELVDKEKPYTLEEVKKEWEELGYEWRIQKEYPHMIWLVNDDEEEKWVLTIKINTQSKKFWKKWGDLSIEPFTLQEHQLLTKTFRALGWDKENNNDK